MFLPLHLLFFFTDTATTEIYTLSLHDALPISPNHRRRGDDASFPFRFLGVATDVPWRSPGSPWCQPSRGYCPIDPRNRDRKSTRLNSSHRCISYAVFCLKKKKKNIKIKQIQSV